jgi:Copper amine oxidase, enzyme domain
MRQLPGAEPDRYRHPEWIKADANLESADVVLWYVFGIHHITRVEDWPIMPVDTVSFWLNPFGFSTGTRRWTCRRAPEAPVTSASRGTGARADPAPAVSLRRYVETAPAACSPNEPSAPARPAPRGTTSSGMAARRSSRADSPPSSTRRTGP